MSSLASPASPASPPPPNPRRSSGPPAPSRARLVRPPGVAGKPPAAPFGLSTWSDGVTDDAAVVVELGAPASSAAPTLAEVIAQVPRASTFASGTLVAVLGRTAPGGGGGLMARLFGKGPYEVPRALRGSALAARGYVAIGGGRDPATEHDLVWGRVP